MNAKHPFLDKAYLWFDPINYFFVDDKKFDKRPSFRWERSKRFRRVAPINNIVDPDLSTPPKKNPPVYLPSIRTIVGAMCPHMPQLAPTPCSMPTATGVCRGEGSRPGPVAGPSRVQAGAHPHGPLQTEEIVIGSDDDFDWDWWGSGRFRF